MPSYRIESQHQTSWLTPGTGSFVDGVEITFTVVGAGTQSIKVPLDQYNAENVKALIDERVAHIIAINTLTGQSGY